MKRRSALMCWFTPHMSVVAWTRPELGLGLQLGASNSIKVFLNGKNPATYVITSLPAAGSWESGRRMDIKVTYSDVRCSKFNHQAKDCPGFSSQPKEMERGHGGLSQHACEGLTLGCGGCTKFSKTTHPIASLLPLHCVAYAGFTLQVPLPSSAGGIVTPSSLWGGESVCCGNSRGCRC